MQLDKFDKTTCYHATRNALKDSALDEKKIDNIVNQVWDAEQEKNMQISEALEWLKPLSTSLK